MASLTLEEYELRTDSKYRHYTATVDKALKSFEYTSEWADLISALGKLNKVGHIRGKAINQWADDPLAEKYRVGVCCFASAVGLLSCHCLPLHHSALLVTLMP